jgi:hypothetical protein
MSKCAECGKEISDGVISGDDIFCNNLCRYSWQNKASNSMENKTAKIKQKTNTPIFGQSVLKNDTPSRFSTPQTVAKSSGLAVPVSKGTYGEREIKDILLQDEAVLQELRNCISQRGLICEQAELVTGKTSGTSVLLMSNGNLGLIPSRNEIKTKVWNPFVVKLSNYRSLYYVGNVSVLSVSKYQKSVESQTFNMQTIKVTYNVDVNKSFQFLSLILAIIVLIGIGKISREAFGLEGIGILGFIVIAIVTTILYQVIKLIRNIKTAKKKSIINDIAQLIDDAVKAFEIKDGVILKNR